MDASRITTPGPLKLRKGDRFTIAGQYRRRTFWQWLLRRPRELQQWVVTADAASRGFASFKQVDK